MCAWSLPAQFGGQEPGSNAEVKKFAQARGAKYPIMAKIDVNGSNGESSLPCHGWCLSRRRRRPEVPPCDWACRGPAVQFFEGQAGRAPEQRYGNAIPVLRWLADSSVEGCQPLRWKETDRRLHANPDIKWNFTKFLVNREGEVVKRWGSGILSLHLDSKLDHTSSYRL